MKKVEIIRCQQTENLCLVQRILNVLQKGKLVFEEPGSCEIIRFVNCGGCLGKRAVARAKMLKNRGEEAVVLASCIKKGNPHRYVLSAL